MQKTPNLNLIKPDGTDVVDIADLNANMDVIDGKLGTTGHNHSGTAGNGPKITNAGLAAGAADDTAIGSRTVNQALASPANVGTITQLLSWLAGRIKTITGATNWYDAPAITLAAINTLFGTSGHSHNGTTGQGPKIAFSNIEGAPSSMTPTAHASTATTYGVSTAANYGHAMASSAVPLVAGSGAAGVDNGKFAREGHVHPEQTAVSGNAGTATKLATARKINGVNFDGTADIQIGAGEPIGMIYVWPSSTIPDGYIECNGQALSRSSFSELFAKIGTIHGVGDGSTTFNAPDFRGVVPRGLDKGRGLDIDGANRTIGSYQADDFKSHSHTIGLGDGMYYGGTTAKIAQFSVTDTPKISGSTGGSETRMKNIGVIYIIKAKNVTGSDPAVNNANAQTLGGFSASAFATAGHNHDGKYVYVVNQQLGENGYIVWSNGKIEQWGLIKTTTPVGNEVPFNILFPTQCFWVESELMLNTDVNPRTPFTWSKTGFKYVYQNVNGTALNPVKWFAIGY
jgi:microcystin-dependent protein